MAFHKTIKRVAKSWHREPAPAPAWEPAAPYAPLRRRSSAPEPRPTHYVNWRTGKVRMAGGYEASFDPRHGAAGLALLLRQGITTPMRHVAYVVCGERAEDAPPPEWYQSAAGAGYTVDYRSGSPRRRAAVCTLPDGSRLDIRHTAAWWGDCTDVDLCLRAAAALERRLRRDFEHEGSRVILWGTPAQTGLHLLELSLPSDHAARPTPRPYEYPVLSDGLRSLLSSEQGGIAYQHRKQLLTAPGLSTIPRFAHRDGRLAYAACLRYVPTGLPTMDGLGTFDRDRPGWYAATFSVPGHWAWPGLGLIRKLPGGGWPGEPGERFTTWANSEETRLAIAYGWGVEIHERLLFAATNTPGSDPLETWGKKLRAAYEDADHLLRGSTADLGRLLKGAIRDIIIDTIGAFARREGERTSILPFGAPLPMDAEPERTQYGWEIRERVPLAAERMRYCQPHWAAHVWAKQRAHALSFVLRHYNREKILGTNTDAWYLSDDLPELYDTGRIGEYRVKGILREELPAPRDMRTLLAYAQRADGWGV